MSVCVLFVINFGINYGFRPYFKSMLIQSYFECLASFAKNMKFKTFMGKSRNTRTFSKIENLRFLQNYNDYDCIFGIKLKDLSLSFI